MMLRLCLLHLTIILLSQLAATSGFNHPTKDYTDYISTDLSAQILFKTAADRVVD